MTNSELFTAAHKLARTFEGNYTARFILALEIIRSSKNDKSNKELISEFWENEYNGIFKIVGGLLIYKNDNKRPVASYDFQLNDAELNNLRNAIPMENADYRNMVREDFRKTLELLGETINID